MLTKGAIGNLINRYRAVLKKCNLINTFGSLAVASMLVLGGAGVACADELTVKSNNDNVVTKENEAIPRELKAASASGGASSYVEVKNNTLTITGCTFKNPIYGGYSDYGGRVYGKAVASDNTLTIINTSITGSSKRHLYAGYATADTGEAIAERNTLSANGGKFYSSLYGGYAYNDNYNENPTPTDKALAKAAYNTIEFSNANCIYSYYTNSIYGGYAEVKKGYYSGNLIDAPTAESRAEYNTATLAGTSTHGVYAYGGYAYGNVGSYWKPGDFEVYSSNNTVNIMGSHAVTAYGGYSQASNIREDIVATSKIYSTNNTVNISGGTLSSAAYGGYAEIKYTDKMESGFNTDVQVTGNTVEISGGDLTNAKVYGGYAMAYYWNNAAVTSYSETIKVHNNTIVLSGDPTQEGYKLDGTELYGGFIGHYKGSNRNMVATGDDCIKGNTLIVKGTGFTAKNIHNFENYGFVLPNDVTSEDVALTLTNAVTDDSGAVIGGTDLTNGGKTTASNVEVAIASGDKLLEVGDKLTLIKNENGLTSGTLNAVHDKSIVGRQGVSIEYTFAVKADETTLYAEVAELPPPPAAPEEPAPQPAVRVNPQTKSLVEGRAAGMAFVNQGSDLIAERGIASARSAAGRVGGMAPFMSAQGGTSRYESGSHVDVSGFSLMAGLALTKPTEIGDATVAAFFESGWGSYDAHNSFARASSVDADGDNRYYGGGVLARMDFADFGPGHAYIEASLRGGWAETDYASSDLRDAFGNAASYDSGAAYYGAHLGLGYEWKLAAPSTLDIYAKYFWTHQEGDSVSVVGDPIEFGDTDSHRLRLGARYSHELNASGMVFKPYVGAAYEYEFDGETGGTTYGLDMDKPELKGSTGMGELGVTFQPTADSSFTFDLGVQGYTGVREGVSGSFMLKYKF